MSWVRIDDGFADNPKILAVGPDGVCLWLCGLAYCNRQPKRDGFIPKAKVALLYPMGNASKAADRLVEAGLWEPAEGGGGFFVHDYHDYQPDAERTAYIRAKRAEAGRNGGLRSGESRHNGSKTEANAKQLASSKNDFCFAGHEAKSNPDPIPEPIPEPREGEARAHAYASDANSSGQFEGGDRSGPLSPLGSHGDLCGDDWDPSLYLWATPEDFERAEVFVAYANSRWSTQYRVDTQKNRVLGAVRMYPGDDGMGLLRAAVNVMPAGKKSIAMLTAKPRVLESWVEQARSAAPADDADGETDPIVLAGRRIQRESKEKRQSWG